MRLVLGLSLCLFATSCVTHSTYGALPSDSQQAAVIVGKTTQADLLLALGKPHVTLDLGDGRSKLSWIKELTHTRVVPFSTQVSEQTEATEFWAMLKGGIVIDKGAGPTQQHIPVSLQ